MRLPILLFCLTGTLPSHATVNPVPVYYTISLADAAAHLVHIKVDLSPGASERELQLPVWNALYQVRDFSQYLNWVRAKSRMGLAIPVRKLDKSRWRIAGAQNGAEIEYEIVADVSGPYNAQLNTRHAFFNLAEVLMYPVDQRSSPVQLSFADLPVGWKIATTLNHSSLGEFSADNYDRLVDSPVEIGTFQEADFDEAGGHYRIVVDADSGDYDLKKIVPTVRSIVAAATTWMKDRPFQSYLFIYHFPRAGEGGMEHAYSTAIDLSARQLTDHPLSFASVTAHEFFHLWNVKRIRPQSLEPVDYTQENYTPSLWFSEGFTSTVEDYILLRAGILDEKQYLTRLAGEIAELQRRSAHTAQSAEESSLDAWLEKYSPYRMPQRSISYYNKGELLGVMLDLEMRDASHNHASLQQLFQSMNQDYAQQGRFFSDSDGVREAAEKVSHAEFGSFFQKYVSGTEEIPWDNFLSGVGLRLVGRPTEVADLGFVATRDFNSSPVIAQVIPGSKADNAGLTAGNAVLEINGRPAGADFEDQLEQLHPGNAVRLKIRDARGDRELNWKADGREKITYELRDVDNITADQKASRALWLKGEVKPAGD